MDTSDVARGQASYRGVDRRLAGVPGAPAPLPMLAAVVAVAVACTAVGGLAVAHDGVATVVSDLRPLLRSALMSGAGLLCLVHWRVSGRSRPAVLGIALLVLGLLSETLAQVAPVLPQIDGSPLQDPVLRTIAAAAAALLLLWSRRTQEVDTSAHPARLLVAVVVLVPVGCGVVVLLAQQLGASAGGVLAAAASAWRAGVWLALAATERPTETNGRHGWLVGVLVCLTLSAAADAVAVLSAEPAGSMAAVLSVAAGVVAVRGAAGDLMGSLARQSSDLHRLQVDVSDHRQRERWAEARHEERLHEVRNVLAGLHGATATLRRYEDRLDVGVRRRLEDAVSGELHRLAHLLDPSPAEALVPLGDQDRCQGAVLRADLRGVRVMARPADLATVVSALLVNARRHAPGSPVSLSAQRRDDEVRILVEDAGPGVPLHLRQAVFERGERGSATAPGSGLGLYTARQLAESMGGTLHVESRGGPGARFVLTLASTTSATVPLQGAQRAPQTGEVDDRAGRVAAAVPAQRQDGAGADLDLAARRHDRDLAGDA